MSEMGELFSAWNKSKQEKRSSNRNSSAAILRQEAMREAFEKWAVSKGWSTQRHNLSETTYKEQRVACMWESWQAATANQEALIKAALDAAAILCDGYEGGDWFADAIRQITLQQVMERMK